jgi:hypothetical protein
LQVGIVIKRVVDLCELAGSCAIGRSKNFKGIPAYWPEAIQRADGQRSIQTRVASNLYVIVLRPINTSDSKRQRPTRTLGVVATHINDQWIQTRRAQSSSIQKNVSFAECEGCCLTGDWYARN